MKSRKEQIELGRALNEKKEKIIELRKAGYSCSEVAKFLNVSESSVRFLDHQMNKTQ